MALQVSHDEMNYQRKQFYETMMNHGTPCKIFSISDYHEDAYDFYNDLEDRRDSFDECIETFMTFEELPTIKTLKSLGWYIDGDRLPAIAYIPVMYMDKKCKVANFLPSVDDKVVFRSNPYDDNSSVREFLLKDFVGNGWPSVIYYTAKLVPLYSDTPER